MWAKLDMRILQRLALKYHPLAKIKVELIEKGRRKHYTHSLGQKMKQREEKNYKRYSKTQ